MVTSPFWSLKLSNIEGDINSTVIANKVTLEYTQVGSIFNE